MRYNILVCYAKTKSVTENLFAQNDLEFSLEFIKVKKIIIKLDFVVVFNVKTTISTKGCAF